MNNLEQQLSITANFSSKKAKVYLALLELGDATIIDIAKKAKLKRSTVYNFIPELIDEGFIRTTTQKGRRYFFIEDPQILKDRAEEKIRNMNLLIPELTKLHTVHTVKPKMTFFEGVGGLKEIYHDIVTSPKPGDTILTTLGPDGLFDHISEETAYYYVNIRIKRKVKIKIIATHNTTTEGFKKTAAKELREIKIVDNPDFMYKADMKIYGNKVAFLSFSENFIGVIIESKEISRMQRASFELMWNLLPN